MPETQVVGIVPSKPRILNASDIAFTYILLLNVLYGLRAVTGLMTSL